MKKYIAKYAFVSGEIGVGDKIRSESFSKHAVKVTKVDDDIYWTDELDYADPLGGSQFGVMKVKALKLSDNLFIYEKGADADIKVGEVSEAAKWVKEGMEFSDDDLLALPGAASIKKPISKWPSAHLVNVTIYVKCPSCGNFK